LLNNSDKKEGPGEVTGDDPGADADRQKNVKVKRKMRWLIFYIEI